MVIQNFKFIPRLIAPLPTLQTIRHLRKLV